MIIAFTPGLKPVLKGDRSAAGRKAAEARWGSRVQESLPEGWSSGSGGDDGYDSYDGPNNMRLVIDKKSGVTIEQAKKQMDQLALLQKIAPVQDLTVVIDEASFSNLGSTNGYVKCKIDEAAGTWTPEAVIHVRPKAIVEPQSNPSLMSVYGSGKDALYTTTHEYGHVLDRRSIRTANEDKAIVISTAQAGMSRYAYEGDEGTSSGREAFAEAWVGWVGTEGRAAGGTDSLFGKPFVRYFAEKYGWDAGGADRFPSATFAKASGTDYILADTFTEEGSRLILVSDVWPDGEPVVKGSRSDAGRKAALARWGNRSGTQGAADTAKKPAAPGGSTAKYKDADQAKKFIEQHYGGWKANLSDAQDKGMRFYQSPGYELMNGQLRGKKLDAPESDLKRAKQATKDLTSAIKDSPPLESDTIVYRGFSADQFDLTPGATIKDNAFISTSLFAEGAGAFAGSGPQVQATIRLPQGTKAAAGSFKELVLPPGAEFKVVSRDGDKVELEYVLSDGVSKGSRSDAGRKAAEARWNQNRGLGIDRADMPQIPKKKRDKFLAELTAEGVEYHDESVDPRTLKQTQKAMNPRQTKVLLDAMRNGTFKEDSHTIVAAKDGHILDGHHRWDAARKFADEGGPATIKITRIDLSIKDLLSRAAEFNAEQGIEARTMDTVTIRKSMLVAFEPGLVPVFKGSRSAAARYAAGVRWSDRGFAEAVGRRDDAIWDALTRNDYSGYNMGESRLVKRAGSSVGRIERKVRSFLENMGMAKKPGGITPDEARALRANYRERYG